MIRTLPRSAVLALFAAAPLCAQPVLVSHEAGAPGTVSNGGSYGVPIRDVGGVSDDGRWCLYISQGTNIVAGQVDTNGDWEYVPCILLRTRRNLSATARRGPP